MARPYKAPLDDIRFVLNEVLNISQLAKLDAYKDVADTETINQFLDSAAAISESVLNPLNQSGDEEGCTYDPATKSVKTPKGFKEAYQEFCNTGLAAFSCDPKYGGLGMPFALNMVIGEMIAGANLSFGLYPGLQHGVYTAMHAVASDDLKNKYLPKLVSGEWGGTMCLTEPQCGTDLGLISTKAVKQADGSYKLTGNKIFISAGDQDLTDNIVHLVLARIDDPETPKGIQGISLFVVPKIIPETGERNDVFAARIEEKMGIHGNATCELNFDGATGQLVGDANKGMKAMFIMMNEERLGVGVQGLGLSEIAYQNGLAYAQERLQSQPIDQDPKDPKRAFIIAHPDVRRELLSIKSTVEGERMLSAWVALHVDLAHHHPDEKERKKAQDFVELLTPIIKAHFTDNAELNTSSAMQVFGGHGYIKEHGMEQFSRDARITRLYEGTNGVQALDLIGRKVLKQRLLPDYLKELEADLKTAKAHGVPAEFRKPVEDAAKKLKAATRRLQFKALRNRKNLGPVLVEAAAVSTDYLKLASLVAMGHMWVKMVDTAQQRLNDGAVEKDFYETKIQTARFYMQKVMPQSLTLAAQINNGSRSLMEIAAEKFAHNQTSVGMKSYAPPSKKAAKNKKNPPSPPAA